MKTIFEMCKRKARFFDKQAHYIKIQNLPILFFIRIECVKIKIT